VKRILFLDAVWIAGKDRCKAGCAQRTWGETSSEGVIRIQVIRNNSYRSLPKNTACGRRLGREGGEGRLKARNCGGDCRLGGVSRISTKQNPRQSSS